MATYANPMGDGFAHYDVAPPEAYIFSSPTSSSIDSVQFKAYEYEYTWPSTTYRQRKPHKKEMQNLSETEILNEKHENAVSTPHTHPRMFLCWVVSVPCRRAGCSGDMGTPNRGARESRRKRCKARCKSMWLGPPELRVRTDTYY